MLVATFVDQVFPSKESSFISIDDGTMNFFRAISLLVLPLIATARFIDEFTVMGSGAQEIPTPVYDTTASAQLDIKFQTDLDAFEFELRLANIKGVTKAHLHCGTAGETGPLVVEFFPTQEPTNYDGFVVGDIFTNKQIKTVAKEACGVTINNVASLYEAIVQRKIYLNIHTEQWPAGELRGQIL